MITLLMLLQLTLLSTSSIKTNENNPIGLISSIEIINDSTIIMYDWNTSQLSLRILNTEKEQTIASKGRGPGEISNVFGTSVYQELIGTINMAGRIDLFNWKTNKYIKSIINKDIIMSKTLKIMNDSTLLACGGYNEYACAKINIYSGKYDLFHANTIDIKKDDGVLGYHHYTINVIDDKYIFIGQSINTYLYKYDVNELTLLKTIDLQLSKSYLKPYDVRSILNKTNFEEYFKNTVSIINETFVTNNNIIVAHKIIGDNTATAKQFVEVLNHDNKLKHVIKLNYPEYIISVKDDNIYTMKIKEEDINDIYTIHCYKLN